MHLLQMILAGVSKSFLQQNMDGEWKIVINWKRALNITNTLEQQVLTSIILQMSDKNKINLKISIWFEILLESFSKAKLIKYSKFHVQTARWELWMAPRWRLWAQRHTLTHTINSSDQPPPKAGRQVTICLRGAVMMAAAAMSTTSAAFMRLFVCAFIHLLWINPAWADCHLEMLMLAQNNS